LVRFKDEVVAGFLWGDVNKVVQKRDIIALSAKYNLTSEEVITSVEKVVSAVITRVTQKDADFHFNRGEIYIYDKNTQVINASKLNSSLVRLIKSKLLKELYLMSAVKKYEAIKSLSNSVIGGIISRKSALGSIYIEINNGDCTFYGVCNKAHQTPKERNKYRLGEYYSFYVNKVILSHDFMRNEVLLSRTSKSLVSGLLQKELISMDIEDINVVCKRRIAGVLSEVIASKRLPKECISAVSKELRENIVVRF